MVKSLKQSFVPPPSSKEEAIFDLSGHKDFLSKHSDLRKYAKRNYPSNALALIAQEIQRLETMAETGSSNDYADTLDYLKLVLELPWSEEPHKRVNLRKAEKTLERTHFGMKKVKERIVEVIAVLNNKRDGQTGAVICLNGPPGVGKTSIAKSIAEAMGRKSFRIAMGGKTDQTSIRGHRRTYTGSRPGSIIDGMRRVGVSNPVIILDEADKVGREENSNAAHALLELLDPEQNRQFRDDYLNAEFDLSGAIFIVTTNDLDKLDPALRDRMEVIELRGYTDEEKYAIARNYLVPKYLKESGLTEEKLFFNEDAIRSLIDDYTQEAGVRRLGELIRTICRKQNVCIQKRVKYEQVIAKDTLQNLIGPPRIYKVTIPPEDTVGLVNGLYYSERGGGIIPVQVTVSPSKRFNQAATVTGLPGAMTTESVECALGTIRSNADRYGISRDILDKSNIRIHLVDGSTPKDGPSAGTAIATALVSAFTKVAVRRDVAMTGEIDLRGNVLPIGGLPEKLEGARKAGAKTVLIPQDNVPDLYEVPDALKKALNIVPVSHIDEVLDLALTQPVTAGPPLSLVA